MRWRGGPSVRFARQRRNHAVQFVRPHARVAVLTAAAQRDETLDAWRFREDPAFRRELLSRATRSSSVDAFIAPAARAIARCIHETTSDENRALLPQPWVPFPGERRAHATELEHREGDERRRGVEAEGDAVEEADARVGRLGEAVNYQMLRAQTDSRWRELKNFICQCLNFFIQFILLYDLLTKPIFSASLAFKVLARMHKSKTTRGGIICNKLCITLKRIKSAFYFGQTKCRVISRNNVRAATYN
jgi:hypothetical protein